MSTKADYSPEQWQLLLDVPPAVGTAVAHAGKSGMGTIKELFAMANSILRADEHFEGNELIQSLVNARLKHGEKSAIETLNHPYVGMEPAQILEDAVERCRSVATLLKSKTTVVETAGYIDWVISVGEKVASAAKEGGLLGIGGERVSEEEKQAISAVTKALKA